jgi:hypothetical protein
MPGHSLLTSARFTIAGSFAPEAGHRALPRGLDFAPSAQGGLAAGSNIRPSLAA